MWCFPNVYDDESQLEHSIELEINRTCLGKGYSGPLNQTLSIHHKYAIILDLF